MSLHYLVKHELPKNQRNSPFSEKNQADTFVTKLWLIIIIIIINEIYIAQVAMQLGNGAANALKQLRGIKQMSFQSVSKNSH